jgi:hypothetical protein
MTDMNTRFTLRQARYQRACWWLVQGVELVPLKPGSKQLQPGYGSRKTHITDPALAAKWFLKTDANLGLVLGSPAGLAVVDWDDRQTYQTWLDTTDVIVDTLTEQTSRGFHSFFIVKELPSVAGYGCEFKTSGVCMVSPSRHPSGVVYQIINNVPILTLDEEKMLRLFPFLSENLGQQRRNDDKTVPLKQTFSQKRTDRPAKDGVVARIKATRSIVAEMSAVGIKLQSGGKHALVGLCPFHDDHSPSLWANPESGLWGCNKPTCPAAGIHDVINFRALARNISNIAAIKQMANEFL